MNYEDLLSKAEENVTNSPRRRIVKYYRSFGPPRKLERRRNQGPSPNVIRVLEKMEERRRRGPDKQKRQVMSDELKASMRDEDEPFLKMIPEPSEDPDGSDLSEDEFGMVSQNSLRIHHMLVEKYKAEAEAECLSRKHVVEQMRLRPPRKIEKKAKLKKEKKDVTIKKKPKRELKNISHTPKTQKKEKHAKIRKKKKRRHIKEIVNIIDSDKSDPEILSEVVSIHESVFGQHVANEKESCANGPPEVFPHVKEHAQPQRLNSDPSPLKATTPKGELRRRSPMRYDELLKFAQVLQFEPVKSRGPDKPMTKKEKLAKAEEVRGRKKSENLKKLKEAPADTDLSDPVEFVKKIPANVLSKAGGVGVSKASFVFEVDEGELGIGEALEAIKKKLEMKNLMAAAVAVEEIHKKLR